MSEYDNFGSVAGKIMVNEWVSEFQNFLVPNHITFGASILFGVALATFMYNIDDELIGDEVNY